MDMTRRSVWMFLLSPDTATPVYVLLQGSSGTSTKKSGAFALTGVAAALLCRWSAWRCYSIFFVP